MQQGTEVFPKFIANLAVLFKYGGVIKSYIKVTKR